MAAGFRGKKGSKLWLSNVAVTSRLSIRKFRNTGDQDALRRHEECKALLLEHGCTERFGFLGWDDAFPNNPDFRKE